ncbi:MAG TPA: hypothetical protein DCE33_09315 [Rhodospirillaceae bacterium]|nr:hypothetical protein [Rhodospirillaceae bacterium]
MADQNGQAGESGATGASGNDRYDVHPEQPLKQYDSSPALAYAASEKRNPSRQLFALVCDPKQPPRHDMISSTRRINQKGLLRIVDWCVVNWSLEGRRCPVLIYDRPRGNRVIANIGDPIETVSEEAVSRNFIQPVTAALRELYNQGITHRAIRPTNLFYDSVSATQANVMLGECLASPTGINQPAVYETIESAMAPPNGRGPGSIADDLYSFGVTILAMLTGRSPCSEMTDDEVIDAKLAQGSYGALIAGHRLSLTMMEVVRGLLMDDVEERWTLEDLDFWIAGRRLSPKQQAMPAKASRAFSFEDRELLTGRDVARAFEKRWDAAIEPVRGGALDTWLRRSLGDEEAIEAVNSAKAAVSVTGTETDDRLLARIIIALDPEGPVRFKSFSASIDGIGGQIAAGYTDENIRKDFAEALRANLIAFSCEMLGGSASDKMRYIPQYDKMKPFLESTDIGQGIERVVYELNPNLPCQSPLLETEYVYDMSEMLHAYERMAQSNPDGMGALVDRHVAAFVATRMKGGLTAELRDLENRFDPAAVAIANVRILGHVQEQAGAVKVPNLCAVAVKMLEPAVERFHSRQQRDTVKHRLQQISKDGRLADILRLVDNSQYLENDRTSYRNAVREFLRSILEMQQMAFEKSHRTQLSRAIGAEIGAFISLILSLIAVVIMGVFWMVS